MLRSSHEERVGPGHDSKVSLAQNCSWRLQCWPSRIPQRLPAMRLRKALTLDESARSAGSVDGCVIRLDDGRRLGFVEYGEPSGPALLYFHGHPGSRLEARFLADAAGRAGLRLISLDRPGLGLSDYQPRRRLRDWSDDVAQIIDRLGLQRVAIIGYSAGAPYALDCAYRLTGRVTACAVVSGAGEVDPLIRMLASWMPWPPASPHAPAVRRSAASATIPRTRCPALAAA
jgi:pimeloyl-ACP methyl ester carboxylesterase